MRRSNAEILRNFQGMVQCKTVSSDELAKIDFNEFYRLHRYLEQTYPLIHQKLTREVIGKASLLFHWQGDGSSAALPIALMAHLDVVPVGDLAKWQHDPFSGDILHGYIWGRGTGDTKCQIVVQMEAIEELLGQGYTPPYDIYLCYGHNEEIVAVGDLSGAEQIVSLLKERGVRLGCVIDEGGTLVDGKVLGVASRIAVIGVAEKGSVHVELSVSDIGGHSSTPKASTALGKVARAAVAVEEHPMLAHLLPLVEETLRALAPEMGKLAPVLNNAAANWPLLQQYLQQSPTTNAMIRTTMAVTMAQGSAQANILPERASMTVNCRLLPGDTMDTLLDYLKSIVDPEVEVKVLSGKNPSPISPTDTAPMRLMRRLITEQFPDTLITPYLVMGGTDSGKYYPICDNVYRFAPFYFDAVTMPTMHSVNERMLSGGFEKAVSFYREFIEQYPLQAQ